MVPSALNSWHEAMCIIATAMRHEVPGWRLYDGVMLDIDRHWIAMMTALRVSLIADRILVFCVSDHVIGRRER